MGENVSWDSETERIDVSGPTEAVAPSGTGDQPSAYSYRGEYPAFPPPEEEPCEAHGIIGHRCASK